MRFNKKQKNFLYVSLGFLLGCIFYETGYYIIKGHPSFQSTPFVMGGAIIGTIIGILATKDK